MNKENNIPLNELQKAQISDFADGQLHGGAFADAMVLLDTHSQSSQARAAWHSLHVVGDVLRTEELVNSAKDVAFLDKFRANLAREPKFSHELSAVIKLSSPASESVVLTAKPVPANEPFFSWKWAAGLSSVVAAVMLGLNLSGTTATSPLNSGAQLAKTTVQIVPEGSNGTSTTTAVMLRNPQLDALIAAHNQVSGSSAFQMPSGFLRSATYNATTLSDK
jgi:sigma-E factor negative regulatory protein RseA